MAVSGKITPESVCCCNCVHWRRHYIKLKNSFKFWPLDNGHCANTARRMPRTKSNDKCAMFTREGDESDAGGEET